MADRMTQLDLIILRDTDKIYYVVDRRRAERGCEFARIAMFDTEAEARAFILGYHRAEASHSSERTAARAFLRGALRRLEQGSFEPEKEPHNEHP